MQVPNIYDCLKQNILFDLDAKSSWFSSEIDWRQEVEMQALLKERYRVQPNDENAKLWSKFIDTLPTLDWGEFVSFFIQCPKHFQSPKQLEVSSSKTSKVASMATMQLLYRLNNPSSNWEACLRVENALSNLEMEAASSIFQKAWESKNPAIVTTHLLNRLSEYMHLYPYALKINSLPTTGVGLLWSAFLIGTDVDTGLTIKGQDIKYYKDCCLKASPEDLYKFLSCIHTKPEWLTTMAEYHEMYWYEPFLDDKNQHSKVFRIYQSLDPGMEPNMLLHLLQNSDNPNKEGYSLESILIS